MVKIKRKDLKDLNVKNVSVIYVEIVWTIIIKKKDALYFKLLFLKFINLFLIN